MRYHYPTAIKYTEIFPKSASLWEASWSFDERGPRWGHWGVGEAPSDWMGGHGAGLAVNALSTEDVASYLWARGKGTGERQRGIRIVDDPDLRLV
jgi:hypothetical protein